MRVTVKIDEEANRLADELPELYILAHEDERTKLKAVSYAVKREHKRLKDKLRKRDAKRV